jgi:hypothetical protein
VPGSFELPVVAKSMAETGKFDAIICIGTVVSERCLVQRKQPSTDTLHCLCCARSGVLPPITRQLSMEPPQVSLVPAPAQVRSHIWVPLGQPPKLFMWFRSAGDLRSADLRHHGAGVRSPLAPVAMSYAPPSDSLPVATP